MKLRMDFVQTTFSKEEPSDAYLQWSRSVCPYCGVGCGLLIGQEKNEILKIKGDPQHPANLGMICAKGGTLAEMMKARAPNIHCFEPVRTSL